MPLAQYTLMWRLENWVTYGFLEASRTPMHLRTGSVGAEYSHEWEALEDRVTALQLISRFFVAAGAGKPVEDWVPPNGANMVQHCLGRLRKAYGVEIEEAEVVGMLRDVGHRRYEVVAEPMGKILGADMA